jgi:hypothetical protein
LIHLSNFTEQRNTKQLETFDNSPTMELYSVSKDNQLMLMHDNDNHLYLLKSPELSVSLQEQTASIHSNPLILASFEPKVIYL